MALCRRQGAIVGGATQWCCSSIAASSGCSFFASDRGSDGVVTATRPKAASAVSAQTFMATTTSVMSRGVSEYTPVQRPISPTVTACDGQYDEGPIRTPGADQVQSR